jgi:hypothetical protein
MPMRCKPVAYGRGDQPLVHDLFQVSGLRFPKPKIPAQHKGVYRDF